MIGINGKKIERAFVNGKPVAMLLTATKKIWEAIRSCFGSGVWRESKAWRENEKWKE